MEQQIDHVVKDTPIKQLKARAQQLQSDAKAAFLAAKKDFDHAKKALRGLQAKSELRAFVSAKLKGPTPKKPKTSAKKAAGKKAVLAPAAP